MSGLLSWGCGGRSLVEGNEPAGNAGASHAGAASQAGGATSSGGTSGGSNASGGNAAAAGDACDASQSCGGDLTGTWSVASSCLRVSGPLDLSSVGIGCKTATVSGHRQVSGTWSAYADGTYRDDTTTTGVDEILLSPACLTLSGTQVPCGGVAPLFTIFGYSSASCEEAPEGLCKCSARIAQSGGLGVVSQSADTSGRWTPSSGEFTVDGRSSYLYCASPSRLTVAPRRANPALAGGIDFERTAR